MYIVTRLERLDRGYTKHQVNVVDVGRWFTHEQNDEMAKTLKKWQMTVKQKKGKCKATNRDPWWF